MIIVVVESYFSQSTNNPTTELVKNWLQTKCMATVEATCISINCLIVSWFTQTYIHETNAYELISYVLRIGYVNWILSYNICMLVWCMYLKIKHQKHANLTRQPQAQAPGWQPPWGPGGSRLNSPHFAKQLHRALLARDDPRDPIRIWGDFWTSPTTSQKKWFPKMGVPQKLWFIVENPI